MGEKMSGRIFITGDKHGTFAPFSGLDKKLQLQAEDIMIIAGDAGYVWDEDYLYNVEHLEQVFAGTVVFIDGNHENHALLNDMEVVTWNGGKAHRVGERVFHLMRGEVYEIDGKRFFVLGGARSVDKDRREAGISWWAEEEPSVAEIAYANAQLQANLSQIDYVITHETPLFARGDIARQKRIDEGYELPKILEEWYHLLVQEKRFKKWYFGHMHVEQLITPKLRAVHNHILYLDNEEPIPWT